MNTYLSKWSRAYVAPLAVASLVLAGAGQAHAEPEDASAAHPEDTVALVQEVAPDLGQPEEIAVVSDGTVEASSEHLVVSIPAESTEVIELTTASESVGFGVPGEVEGEVVDGTVVYENSAASTDILVEPVDNGVRALIKIDGPDAPTRFDFPVEVPDGGMLSLTSDGGAVVLDSNGDMVVEIQPPWAKDANGSSLPTHFEVTEDGGRLVQIVEHGHETAYPVVADPVWLAPLAWWAGKRLVRAVAANWIAKQALQRWGYRCDPFGPAFLCYKYVQ